MDPFHERLARVALEVTASYGFALAGGYAVQAHGFLDRHEALEAVDRIPDTGFAEYGLDPASAAALRSRMHAWAKKISGS
jgi:hypothetical protein